MRSFLLSLAIISLPSVCFAEKQMTAAELLEIAKCVDLSCFDEKVTAKGFVFEKINDNGAGGKAYQYSREKRGSRNTASYEIEAIAFSSSPVGENTILVSYLIFTNDPPYHIQRSLREKCGPPKIIEIPNGKGISYVYSCSKEKAAIYKVNTSANVEKNYSLEILTTLR